MRSIILIALTSILFTTPAICSPRAVAEAEAQHLEQKAFCQNCEDCCYRCRRCIPNDAWSVRFIEMNMIYVSANDWTVITYSQASCRRDCGNNRNLFIPVLITSERNC